MLKDYRWKCPYSLCKYEILSYTEDSFDKRRSEHLEEHLKKLREEREERERRLSMHLPIEPDPVETDLDVLTINRGDLNFLKSRQIALDDKIEIDLSLPHAPEWGEEVKNWSRILERAWTSTDQKQ
jgi:hypothetical protein